jgi:hypothetical protein
MLPIKERFGTVPESAVTSSTASSPKTPTVTARGRSMGWIGPAPTSGSPEGLGTQKCAYNTINHLSKYVTQLGEYDYAVDWSGYS